MGLDLNQITLTTVSVRLDSKKITNALLDQIPRIDFCELLVNNEGDYLGPKVIESLCRFSLVSFLNSERRIYKSKGYDAAHTSRLMEYFNGQDEAFLFTVKGQIYCDSISLRTGTKKYAELFNKLQEKISNTKYHLENFDRILDLNKKGIGPEAITKECRHGILKFHLRSASPSTNNLLANWDDNFDDWDDDDKTQDSKALNRLIKKYGSWDDYITIMENEVLVYKADKKNYENDMETYENEVTNTISDLASKPFAILGC